MVKSFVLSQLQTKYPGAIKIFADLEKGEMKIYREETVFDLDTLGDSNYLKAVAAAYGFEKILAIQIHFEMKSITLCGVDVKTGEQKILPV